MVLRLQLFGSLERVPSSKPFRNTASLLRLLFAPQPTILAISDATARVSVKEAGLGVYTVEPLYPDTNGAEENVIVSEVSSFQRLKEWYLE